MVGIVAIPVLEWHKFVRRLTTFAPDKVYVGNQQKWDTFVEGKLSRCGSVAGHPELPVVALAPL